MGNNPSVNNSNQQQLTESFLSLLCGNTSVDLTARTRRREEEKKEWRETSNPEFNRYKKKWQDALFVPQFVQLAHAGGNENFKKIRKLLEEQWAEMDKREICQDALLMAIEEYAKAHPKVLTTIAISQLGYLFPDDSWMSKLKENDCARHLDHLARNAQGQTSLMIALNQQHRWSASSDQSAQQRGAECLPSLPINQDTDFKTTEGADALSLSTDQVYSGLREVTNRLVTNLESKTGLSFKDQMPIMREHMDDPPAEAILSQGEVSGVLKNSFGNPLNYFRGFFMDHFVGKRKQVRQDVMSHGLQVIMTLPEQECVKHFTQEECGIIFTLREFQGAAVGIPLWNAIIGDWPIKDASTQQQLLDQPKDIEAAQYLMDMCVRPTVRFFGGDLPSGRGNAGPPVEGANGAGDAHVKAILSFLDNKEDLKALLDAQDTNGETAAHYCVRRALSSHDETAAILQVLIDHEANTNIKNKHGKTPLQLALDKGSNERILSVLRHSGALKQTTANDESLAFPGIFKLYEPSAVGGTTQTAAASPTVTKYMLRYIEREIPPLAKSGSPKFFLVPPSFPEECPHESEGQRKGWESEKKVYQALKEAMQELQAESSEVTLVLFHGLRFAANLQLSGSTSGPNDQEIDVVLLAMDALNEIYSSMALEIKSETSLRGAIRFKGIAQLERHLDALKSLLNGDFSWVKFCLTLPNCPVTEASPEACKNAEKDQKDKKLKNSRLVAPQDRLVFLQRIILEDKNELKKWLKEHLLTPTEGAAETELDAQKEEFLKLAFFCLTRSLGVIVSNVSAGMDELALLTMDQKAILDESPSSGKPLVICGGSGTGKSFLAEHKLKQLGATKQINAGKMAIFVSKRENIAFNAHMKQRLSQLENIHFKECSSLEESYAEILSGTSGFKYAIFDQLEDYQDEFFTSVTKGDSLFTRMVTTSKLDMLWMIINPYDWNNGNAMESKALQEIMVSSGEHKVFFSDTRLRNSQAISNVLDQFEHAEMKTVPVAIRPKPAGHAGVKILVAVYNDLRKGQGWENCLRTIAKTIAVLSQQKHNILSEDMLVVNGESKQRNPILAPLFQIDGHLERMSMTKNSPGGFYSGTPIPVAGPLLKGPVPFSDAEIEEALGFLEKFMKHLGHYGMGVMAETFLLEHSKEVSAGCDSRNILLLKMGGLVRRMVNLWQHGKASKGELRAWTKSFMDCLSSRDQKKIQAALDKHRYVSVMDADFVRGHEADAVISYHSKIFPASVVDLHLLRVLSRAKVMVVMVIPSLNKKYIDVLDLLGGVEELNLELADFS